MATLAFNKFFEENVLTIEDTIRYNDKFMKAMFDARYSKRRSIIVLFGDNKIQEMVLLVRIISHQRNYTRKRAMIFKIC